MSSGGGGGQTVQSTEVSSIEHKTAPVACLAMRPVSNVTV